MFRRAVAALFVGAWLVLFGIEVFEDVGLVEYEEPEMDRTVEATLASLGDAIKVSGAKQPIPLSASFTEPAAFYSSVSRAISFRWVRKETERIKEDIPIYKLHRTFLI